MIRALVFLTCLIASSATAERLRLVSTTTTQNSGLMADLLPQFEAATGIRADLLVTGTGQALRIGAQGDGDVLLVHDPEGEAEFVKAGYGAARNLVMYNHFLLVGPLDDPAGLRQARDVADAFARLSKSGAPFLSRGDDSGTHRRELRLWPTPPQDTWYRETGAGMGTTLNIASAQGSYTLVDIASWSAFSNKGDLAVLFEDPVALRNPYSIIALNPARHEHVNFAGANALIDWLLSTQGQRAIAAFAVDGRQVFCPAQAVPDVPNAGFCNLNHE